MSKIILTVNYEIIPEKRDEYLVFMKEVKSSVKNKFKCDYSLFEQLGKKNQFSEMYTFANQEEYDKYDELDDEKMDQMVSKINEEFVKDGKVKYTQIIEIF